ncbi:globin-coupled sensor protein, partial [Pseudomonas sp. HMWF010]
ASTRQVEAGVGLVGQTGEALRGIVAKVADIDGLIVQISSSSQEQATGLNEVNTAVNQMDQVTQQNAAMVEETTAATHSLKNQTAELVSLISAFRVSGARSAGAQPPAAARPAPAARPGSAARPGARGGTASAAAARQEWEEF